MHGLNFVHVPSMSLAASTRCTDACCLDANDTGRSDFFGVRKAESEVSSHRVNRSSSFGKGDMSGSVAPLYRGMSLLQTKDPTVFP